MPLISLYVDEHACPYFSLYLIIYFLLLILTYIIGVRFLSENLPDDERFAERSSLLSHKITHIVKLVHEFSVYYFSLV